MKLTRSSLLYLLLALLTVVIGIVTNIATNQVPDWIKPYLWLSWPILLVLTSLFIALSVHQATRGEPPQFSRITEFGENKSGRKEIGQRQKVRVDEGRLGGQAALIPPITWLHISDLHFRKDDYNSSIIREAFLQDLKSMCLEKNLHIDLILVTGDIAFSGQPEEYKLARVFFDNLLSLTQLSKERLFIVPGNHDVDRREIGTIAASASTLLDSRDAVNDILTDTVECSYICRRLSNYVQFLVSYLGDEICSNTIRMEPHYYARTLSLTEKSVTVLALNSAWLSAGDNDRHNLLVGERQVRDAISKSKGADLTIALLHHTFDWLKEFDENDAQTLLHQECDFILRGHLHKTRLGLTVSPDANVLQIAAGALCETRQSPNAYNIVQFNIETGEGTVHLRRYSDEAGGFFAKDTLTYRNAPEGEYSFLLGVRHKPHELGTQLSVDSFLFEVALRLLNRTGKRRTAYPTDMNFRELYEEQVYIPPLFPLPYETTAPLMSLDQLLDQLDLGSSVLVMGEPGSGKSFFTYLVQQHMARSRSRVNARTCIPIDLRLFIESAVKQGLAFDFQAILRILWDSYHDEEYPFSPGDKPTSEILFILDGIDELSGNPSHVNALTQLLNGLGRIGNVLVTCRTRDFEHVFAPYLDPSLFDLMLKIKEWEVELEFTEFIRKLESAGRFSDDAFLQRVKSSTKLRALASRPLHARMLTFVSKPDVKEVVDISQLYGDYLHKYATIVDSSLITEGCLQKPETYLLWRESAWHAFKADLLVHDRIPLTALNDFLVNRHGMRLGCVPRLLYPLFNSVPVFHSTQLQFIHYSFFEYLVAESIAEALIRSCRSDSMDIYSYFAKDLTQEIRRHLVRIINRTKLTVFRKWLAKGYLAINDATPNRTSREVANNLLVYVLARLKEDVSNEMWALLQSETDDFLRTSLFWGLCVVVGLDAVGEYLETLASSARMRSLNRGYHLYYYSDLDRSKDPPYLDDDPSRSWANTKLRMLQFMAAPDYHSRVPVGRRTLDLYTFYDLCLFRNESVFLDDETSVLSGVLRVLENEVKDEDIIQQLRTAHQQIVQPR